MNQQRLKNLSEKGAKYCDPLDTSDFLSISAKDRPQSQPFGRNDSLQPKRG